MSSKSFSLFVLSIFALVFVMGMASAASLTQWNFDSSSLTPSTGAGTLTINDGATASYVNGNPATGKALSTANWDANEYFNIAINTSGYENIILSFDEETSATGPASFKIQYSSDGTTFTDLSGTPTSTVAAFTANPMHTFDFSAITAIDNNANTKLRIVVPTAASNALGAFHLDNLLISGTALPITPSETTCTATGNPGELKIKKIDFTNNGLSSGVTFGEDDQWFPFEEIEAEVQIKNDGNDNINNIELDWGIYNTKTNEWVIEMDNLKDFDLKDGDTKTFTIPFTIDDGMDIDLADLSDGEDYKFYVTATGEVDNDTAPSTCATDSEPASIVIESDFVILDNIQIPETIQCGQIVEVTADVWNIGDNDQDEVSIDVSGRESALKLTQTVDAGDINAFDKQEISFTFTIPKNLEEKTYALKLEVRDDNNDVYKNDFNDDYSEFTIPLAVKGSCSLESQLSVAASTVSGGQEGQKLVVKATITNNADEQKTYTISTSGFEAWASASSLDQSAIILNAGESKDVLVTLNINKDAAGSQTFSLVMTSGSEILTQPVTVSIEESKGLFGITGNVISGSNWYVWALGALILILILVIILVAVRVGRK